jgi:hypothetical protein
MVSRALRWPRFYGREGDRGGRRLVAVFLVGAALCAVAAFVWRREHVKGIECVPDPTVMFSCFGPEFVLSLVGGPALFLAATVALWRIASLPVLTAAIGVILSVVALLLYQSSIYGSPPPPIWLALLVGGACFAVAAVASARGAGWLLRTGTGLLAVGALVAAPLLDTASTAAYRQERFGAVSVPLLVPEHPGYRIRSASADPIRSIFTTVLVPVGSDDPYRTHRAIRAYVVPLPPGFAPPGRCGPSRPNPALPIRNTPCRPVGSDHWVRTEMDVTEHIVRHAEALVFVWADTGYVPEEDLAAAASHLRTASVDELIDAL